MYFFTLNILCLYLNFSDFCKKELNEQSFSRKVARLNTNILYLCYTQRVKLSSLTPNHTLENISRLLDLECSDLGRIGPCDTNDSFNSSSHFQLMQNLSSGDSGSDDEGNFESYFFCFFCLFPPKVLNLFSNCSVCIYR